MVGMYACTGRFQYWIKLSLICVSTIQLNVILFHIFYKLGEWLASDSVPPPPSIFEMHIFLVRQDKFYV